MGEGSYQYRMDIAYKGTAYNGWQTQPSKNSVQDHLENALSTALRSAVRVLGASRTDSGVHAEQQVAVFRISHRLNDTNRLRRSLNALIPNDIQVLYIRQVDLSFHPIIDASWKTYRYRLWLGSAISPFASDFVWPIHGTDFDSDALVKAAKFLEGDHDFKSFCASDSSAQTTRRSILSVHVLCQHPLVEIYITGTGFLKQMVRSIVGTLVEVANGRRSPEDISAIIGSKSRAAAGKTAPAAGLSLVHIAYDNASYDDQFISSLQQTGLSFRLLRESDLLSE
jgi:tRNA pseudouridine38-40 synthase